MAEYVGAIDQGTTSTRFMVFDHSGQVKGVAQKEHEQLLPKPGWVEHDPREIVKRTSEVVGAGLGDAGINRDDLVAVGITNQRETAIVWERDTGRPVHNAIVWQDTRTDRICAELAGSEGPDRFRSICGLPISTYFSGPKIMWLLQNVDGVRERAERGEVLFGTVDSWLVWNLTGGPHGGVHVTDPTNASRTMLMNLETLEWENSILDAMVIPRAMLPEIRSSSEVYGEGRSGPLGGVALAGILGDQQAAMFGQTCFDKGDAKNTYGTGNFLLVGTGEEAVQSQALLTTVCYKLRGERPAYALEGAIAVTGAAVQWLRDNLRLIRDAREVEELAGSVADNGGCYFVPAFSGLFAPYWKSGARGVIAGLTRYVNSGHIARAALEATAFQSREVVDAVNADAEVRLTELKVDGGMVGNELLMQFQADIVGMPVIRPRVAETTALGAAYAAGLAVGFWADRDDLRQNWGEERRWEPRMDVAERERSYRLWKKAVERTFDWVEEDEA